MRHAILLLSAIFLLLGCSNNDNDVVQEEEQQVTELKIKKFRITTFWDESNPDRHVDHYFDEEGKLTQVHEIDINTYHLVQELVYNDLGLITEVKDLDEPPLAIRKYNYDSSNRLIEILKYDETGAITNYHQTTHTQDSIEVTTHGNNQYTHWRTYRFEPENQLNQIKLRNNNSPSTITKNYIYHEGNLVKYQWLNYANENNIYYEYDNKINPLHATLLNNYKTLVLGGGFSINNLNDYFTDYYYSKNNQTHISTPNDDRIITYEYNDLDYPVSATVLIGGNLYRELNYEYY